MDEGAELVVQLVDPVEAAVAAGHDGDLRVRSIATHLELADDASRPAVPDRQQLVFGITRECLRNASRHASAQRDLDDELAAG